MDTSGQGMTPNSAPESAPFVPAHPGGSATKHPKQDRAKDAQRIYFAASDNRVTRRRRQTTAKASESSIRKSLVDKADDVLGRHNP